MTEIPLDFLANEWIYLRLHPNSKDMLERKLLLNKSVAAYARQECILMPKAWSKVKVRAYEIISTYIPAHTLKGGDN